jgi:hypothetical protein
LTTQIYGIIFPIMNDKATNTILLALARVLRPIVRVLLANKITYAAFDQIARQVFVEVATKDFTIKGRKQTVSRIALVTGLSRKEVLRLRRENPLADRELSQTFHRASRLISRWCCEPAFMDEDGEPRPLKLEGPGSFSELVGDIGGDLPPRSMLDELRQAGIVKMDAGRRIYLMRKVYVPSKDEIQMMKILGTDAGDLAETIAHNLRAPDPESRFQLKVAYDNLPEECLHTLHHMVSERGHELLVEFDRWLRQHDRDLSPRIAGTGQIRAGVGIYYFENRESA